MLSIERKGSSEDRRTDKSIPPCCIYRRRGRVWLPARTPSASIRRPITSNSSMLQKHAGASPSAPLRERVGCTVARASLQWMMWIYDKEEISRNGDGDDYAVQIGRL